MKLFLATIFFIAILSASAQNREHAFEINSKLGRGINFGNMFEAPSENAWGNPWMPDYPKMISELGFKHVRIPIRWEPEERSSSTYPYTINPVFLARIKQVVDSCLSNGLLAIINMHHHDALFEDPDGQKARFLAQWKQISEYFKAYPDSLLFEILNEPNGNLTAEKWNIFLVDALSTIREDNPDRIVLIGTSEWGGLGGLSKLQIPDDQNIILTVHYYNPFQFTHQGAEWVDGSNAWLGTKWNDTETERQVMQNEFAPLKTIEEQQHIPIHIGEFGSYSKADAVSRKKWSTYLPRYLETLGWSWAYWEFSAGFGIYDPSAKIYNQNLVNALLHDSMPEPAYYMGTSVYTSNFSTSTLGWTVHTNGGASATKLDVDNKLLVQITTAGTEGWHVQLVKSGVRLKAGKKYRVTFIAKAENNRQISAYCGQSVSPWSAYSGYNGITLGTEMTEYSYIFDMNTDDDAARLVFDLGISSEDVYFKSIVLESVELQYPSSAAITKNVSSRIYPNPVKGQMLVDNLDGFSQIVVQNIQGSILLKQSLNTYKNEIDLSNLASGIYFVSLLNQTDKFTMKIIKN